MRTSNLLLVIGISLGIATPVASRAAIVETIIDPGTAIAFGSISFPTFTGSSDTGVLLSFDGYTETDITSISWTLDPSTDDVLAIDLRAVQGDLDCPGSETVACSNTTLHLTIDTAGEGGNGCTISDIGPVECRGTLRDVDVAYVPTPVPEPSTWVLGIVGLLGLGWIRRFRVSPLRARVAVAD